MPRFPAFADRNHRITGSVYEKFRARMAAQGDRLVGLHIGDSYAPPPYPLPLDPSFAASRPGYNRYCDTFGVGALRDALVEKLCTDNAMSVRRENVVVTCGATNALAAAVQVVVDPGDEVLLLAPYWPFFRGMVRAAGGDPIEVPFYTRLNGDEEANVAAWLEDRINPRTVAVYVNSPNNPSGKVLSRGQLTAIAAAAGRHGLWLITDEAYDGMTFDGRAHVSVASLPEAAARTISVFTFSKVFMLAGLRLGYAVAPERVVRAINRAMVHQVYSPSTLGQEMMVEPVRTRAQWSRRFVDEFQRTRDAVAAALRVEAPLPEGAYYFFFPVEAYLRGRTVEDVVNECIDAGVSAAPGEDFGADYAQWLRICFAGEPPDRVLEGIARLNRVLVG